MAIRINWDSRRKSTLLVEHPCDYPDMANGDAVAPPVACVEAWIVSHLHDSKKT